MRVDILAGFCVLMISAVASADTTSSPGAAPLETMRGPVAEELRRIQRDLGGSAVEAFPSLREERGHVIRMRGAASGPAGPSREAVEALREAASQLDTTANRLERLELYAQADALRAQAQRLRLDARGRIPGAATPTPSPVLPWGEGVQPSGGAPFDPRLAEPQPLEPLPADPLPLEPVPLQPDAPSEPPPPRLEPTPSPK